MIIQDISNTQEESNNFDNEEELFTDMMQRYFGQPADVKMEDARPDVHYQVQWQRIQVQQ